LNNRPIKSKGTGEGDRRPGEGRGYIKTRAKGKILTVDEETTETTRDTSVTKTV
jgi:hypothetical protein